MNILFYGFTQNLVQSPSSGSFVYRLKESESHIEPIHDICPNCYNRAIKSILQFSGHHKSNPKYVCHHCDAVILADRPKITPEDVKFVSTSSSRWNGL